MGLNHATMNLMRHAIKALRQLVDVARNDYAGRDSKREYQRMVNSVKLPFDFDF